MFCNIIKYCWLFVFNVMVENIFGIYEDKMWKNVYMNMFLLFFLLGKDIV